MSAALVAVLAVFAQAPAAPRVDAEVAFAYGFGSRSAFGTVALATAGWPAWETRGGQGLLTAGVMGGYQYESYAASAAFLAPAQVSGSNHRSEVFAVAGHTLRLFPSRRLLVGLQLFAGWTHLAMRGSLTDAAQGVSGSYRADADEFTLGLLALAGVELSDRVAIVARFILPIPYAGIAVSSYFMASLGASLRF